MVAPAGVYFLTSCSQWNDYALPAYALSGSAGLLGVVCELAFPLLLIVRSSSGRSDARLVPVSVGGAG